MPISLGIPAIAIGAGGRGGGVHTPAEWYDNTDGTVGVARALAIVVGGWRDWRVTVPGRARHRRPSVRSPPRISEWSADRQLALQPLDHHLVADQRVVKRASP